MELGGGGSGFALPGESKGQPNKAGVSNPGAGDLTFSHGGTRGLSKGGPEA